MRITIIQYDISWEDKQSNLNYLEKIVSPLSGKTDLIILPEMFNTGFSMNPDKLCENPDSNTLSWMKNLAEEGKFAVCGSYIVKEAGKAFNRFVFVASDGETTNYDKRHLFSMGNEDKFFSKGKKRVIFSYRGFRIMPIICYDLRFPVWSRNRNDYDLLICVANWPESRREVWNTLLKARAIENQCYVAGANRVGTDGTGIKYSGDSAILNPRGETLQEGITNTEFVITADLSLSELNAFREKFPAWKDADDFSIII